MLLEHYLNIGKTLSFNEADQSNVLFSLIKRLMLQSECCSYILIQAILIPLIFNNNTLKYLHLIFKEPASNYPMVLSEPIIQRISVQSMILEVEQGMLLKIVSKLTA
ncbi:unnamed protein product [Adineta steineri]|uniref:Uncharacterized protein n=1 Tax=Adineta steineri TaxID=433720 RepID=A0A816FS35_9BILA|nr:unnamed protein product [Adineta steineri]CAF1665041.1 unnamed protein product [Adineta steineri]